jgi:hypothetical protein
MTDKELDIYIGDHDAGKRAQENRIPIHEGQKTCRTTMPKINYLSLRHYETERMEGG